MPSHKRKHEHQWSILQREQAELQSRDNEVSKEKKSKTDLGAEWMPLEMLDSETQAALRDVGYRESAKSNYPSTICICDAPGDKPVPAEKLIRCSNRQCETELFHLVCVDLWIHPPPLLRWSCPDCIGLLGERHMLGLTNAKTGAMKSITEWLKNHKKSQRPPAKPKAKHEIPECVKSIERDDEDLVEGEDLVEHEDLVEDEDLIGEEDSIEDNDLVEDEDYLVKDDDSDEDDDSTKDKDQTEVENLTENQDSLMHEGSLKDKDSIKDEDLKVKELAKVLSQMK